jgi:hypothetical protein
MSTANHNGVHLEPGAEDQTVNYATTTPGGWRTSNVPPAGQHPGAWPAPADVRPAAATTPWYSAPESPAAHPQPPHWPGAYPGVGGGVAPSLGSPQWPGPSTSRPSSRGSRKWLVVVGTTAVIAIIAATVALFALRDNGSGAATTSAGQPGTGSTSASGPAGDGVTTLSDGDTGPAAIILGDPTCPAFRTVNTQVYDAIQAAQWQTLKDTPSASWTTAQRASVDKMVSALRSAIEQTQALAKQTPHRVMRELYEQHNAYTKMAADRLANYQASDSIVNQVTYDFRSAIDNACAAVDWNSAQARVGQVAPIAGPSAPLAPTNTTDPGRFLTAIDPVCSQVLQRQSTFSHDTAAWGNMIFTVPGNQWTPQQSAVEQAAVPVFKTYADDLEKLGRKSSNPLVQDFSAMAAQYYRAYASSIGPDYAGQADNFLVAAAFGFDNTVADGCTAATK